ncbi:hypothetical protein Salat_2116500 [Sesamum alatum]|uniref:Uncharacterized protein n=1 Tax=Sesamum alatum TaxID=300844 RepID=A0AAE1Y105_9LAMI|nr:hypothetical protein Salat_2116500 [Sesamum alatum]
MEVLAKVGIHVHLRPSPSLHTLLRLHTQKPLFLSSCRSVSVHNHRCFLLLSPWPLHICRSRQWDSNAETQNTKNFNFGDDDESEDFDGGMEQWTEVLEDYIDSIWILKVFRSFGWLLPAIVIPLLLANGPKAFLMALALPLGQSTFAFAIQKYQNRGKIKPKPKPKTKTKKKKSRSYSSRKGEMEEEAEWIGSQQAGKKKKGYQSWVSQTDVSVNSNNKTAANFGGWDELDVGMDPNVGFSRRAAQKSSWSREGPSEKGKNKKWEKGKNKKWTESDGRLLLRCITNLLIIQLGSCLNMEFQGDIYRESKVDEYSLRLPNYTFEVILIKLLFIASYLLPRLTAKPKIFEFLCGSQHAFK